MAEMPEMPEQPPAEWSEEAQAERPAGSSDRSVTHDVNLRTDEGPASFESFSRDSKCFHKPSLN